MRPRSSAGDGARRPVTKALLASPSFPQPRVTPGLPPVTHRVALKVGVGRGEDPAVLRPVREADRATRGQNPQEDIPQRGRSEEASLRA